MNTVWDSIRRTRVGSCAPAGANLSGRLQRLEHLAIVHNERPEFAMLICILDNETEDAGDGV